MKWDSNALWLKAKLYIDRAHQFRQKTTDFPLWSALALELLARAALTKIHPALNADPRDDVNLLYAYGYQVTGQPKSLPLHSVFLRLEKTIPRFGKVQRELCDYLSLLRNEELHAGELPFENLKESTWLPRYYDVCEILCEHMGKTLADFLGPDVAQAADALISALGRGIEKIVKDKISAHKKDFSAKEAGEQLRLREEASVRVRHLHGKLSKHACPACESEAILRGSLIKELKPIYEDEALIIDQEFLASELRCLACDLHLASPDEIMYAGIEPRFSGQRVTDLHELFDPEDPDPYMNM